MTTANRRQMLKSTFGALSLAGGSAQNGVAQTSPPTTPAYALLSTAVLYSNGLVAGNVWTGMNTGVIKSDDLVRAAALLRVQTDHFEEIGVNTYVNTQFSQPPTATISPNVFHAIGEQIRSYGILMTDAQIQGLYPSDVNARGQALLYASALGIRGVQVEIADSLDLAARKLRLQEIATACGTLLDLLPSSLPSMRAMQANDLSPQASTACFDWQNRIYVAVMAATAVAAAAAAGCAPCAPVAAGMFMAAAYEQWLQHLSCG